MLHDDLQLGAVVVGFEVDATGLVDDPPGAEVGDAERAFQLGVAVVVVDDELATQTAADSGIAEDRDPIERQLVGGDAGRCIPVAVPEGRARRVACAFREQLVDLAAQHDLRVDEVAAPGAGDHRDARALAVVAGANHAVDEWPVGDGLGALAHRHARFDRPGSGRGPLLARRRAAPGWRHVAGVEVQRDAWVAKRPRRSECKLHVPGQVAEAERLGQTCDRPTWHVHEQAHRVVAQGREIFGHRLREARRAVDPQQRALGIFRGDRELDQARVQPERQVDVDVARGEIGTCGHLQVGGPEVNLALGELLWISAVCIDLERGGAGKLRERQIRPRVEHRAELARPRAVDLEGGSLPTLGAQYGPPGSQVVEGDLRLAERCRVDVETEQALAPLEPPDEADLAVPDPLSRELVRVDVGVAVDPIAFGHQVDVERDAPGDGQRARVRHTALCGCMRAPHHAGLGGIGRRRGFLGWRLSTRGGRRGPRRQLRGEKVTHRREVDVVAVQLHHEPATVHGEFALQRLTEPIDLDPLDGDAVLQRDLLRADGGERVIAVEGHVDVAERGDR